MHQVIFMPLKLGKTWDRTEHDVVGIAKLSVDDDASCIITHAYQPCLLRMTGHWVQSCQLTEAKIVSFPQQQA